MSGLEDIVQRLRGMLVERFDVRTPPDQIDARTPLFAGGLELNSFAVVELIGLVENAFQFQFRETDFREEHFRTVETLAQLILQYRSAPNER